MIIIIIKKYRKLDIGHVGVRERLNMLALTDKSTRKSKYTTKNVKV